MLNDITKLMPEKYIFVHTISELLDLGYSKGVLLGIWAEEMHF